MNSSLPLIKHNHCRVLIVDDTPQVRRDLHQFLELTGEIKVIAEAADGQDAVRLATELLPDVIVMDLEMPGLDGFEATRQIKARQPSARINGVDEAWAIGTDGRYRLSPDGEAFRGYWRDAQTFQYIVFDVGAPTYQLHFDGDRLEVTLPDLETNVLCQGQKS